MNGSSNFKKKIELMMPATSVYSAPKDDDENGISWKHLSQFNFIPSKQLVFSREEDLG